MDLDISDEDLVFAERLWTWLSENVEPQWLDRCTDYDDYVAEQDRWEKLLTGSRWAGVWWPKEHGGMGATPAQRAIYAEMTARLGAPEGSGKTGRRMLGPAVMRYGTPEQQEWVLPGILEGKHVWCQSFSEPDAGSDVASIRTRARRDGDAYVLNGSKIWTSHAQHATHSFILVRTGTGGDKHGGVSILLIDMDSPGIDIRPIQQIIGMPDYSEVFYDDVVVPAGRLLGSENQGWEIARYIMRYERGAVMVFDTLVRIERHLEGFARSVGESSFHRTALGRSAAKLAASRLLAYRVLGQQVEGGDPTDAGSIAKLYWSLTWLELGKAAQAATGELGLVAEPLTPEDTVLRGFFGSRPMTIGGGTVEIQRNIIAKRVLGLPTS
jgi:alkylation response protein AidB-like acyl-CoA dehydrogenase